MIFGLLRKTKTPFDKWALKAPKLIVGELKAFDSKLAEAIKRGINSKSDEWAHLINLTAYSIIFQAVHMIILLRLTPVKKDEGGILTKNAFQNDYTIIEIAIYLLFNFQLWIRENTPNNKREKGMFEKVTNIFLTTMKGINSSIKYEMIIQNRFSIYDDSRTSEMQELLQRIITDTEERNELFIHDSRDTLLLGLTKVTFIGKLSFENYLHEMLIPITKNLGEKYGQLDRFYPPS